MELRSALGSIGDVSVVVVGGANTDIIGVSAAPLVEEDSNPGHVEVSAGGVGRNIAENLARLGVATSLVTAFGGDSEAKALRAHCVECGIDISASIIADDLPGARYLAIADEHGDMALAVNDMRVLERVTASYVTDAPVALKLREADMIVIDTNVGFETLSAIAATVRGLGVPLVADTVSAAKAHKLSGLLPELAAVKTNAIEAEALIGSVPLALELHPLAGAVDQGDELAHTVTGLGAKHVFLTLAEEGCVYRGPDDSGVVETVETSIVSTTGAGDSFTAGVAIGLIVGLDSRQTATLGSVIASRTMAVESSVDPDLDLESIVADTEELLG